MKQAVKIIVALAFFLQAMIPLGFMPNANAADNTTALVICSGPDLKTIYVDQNGKPVQHQEKMNDSSQCPYSTLTTFNPPADFTVSPVPVVYGEASLPVLDSHRVSLIRFLRPHAIGPPALL